MKRQAAPARHRTWLVPAFISGGTALLLAGILAWAVFAYDGVYPNVTFAGTKIGGMSKGEAKAVIESVMATYAEDKIKVSFGDETRSISVLDAGSVLSAPEVLQAAVDVGRTGNVFERIGTVISSIAVPREVLSETDTDTAAIKEFLSGFEGLIFQEKTDPDYRVLDNVIQIDKGSDGRRLDIDKAAADIAVRIKNRNLDNVNLNDFVIYDKAKTVNLLDIYNEVYRKPADAQLDLSGKEPKVVPSTAGVQFDLANAEKLMNDQSPDKKSFTIPLIKADPEITTEEFEQLLFRDVLSEAKTTLNASNLNRTGNVRLSANAINGKVLNPGDVFSYNDTVGERSYENGYKDASVYTSDGIEDQLGGGICQTSSTLYMNVIRAGLDIVERYNHSYTVVYAPLGEDATVYWGSLDFKFSNNRRFPIKIVAYQEKDYVVVRILGTKEDNNRIKIETVALSHTPYETTTVENPQMNYGTKKQKTEGHSAYKVESYRVVYDENGKEISRVRLPGSQYKKLDRVIEVGTKGAPTSTVAPVVTGHPGSPSPSGSASQSPPSPPSVSPTASPSVSPATGPDGSESGTDNQNP